MGWEFSSGGLEILDSLAELDETGLGGITFAVSVDVEELLFGALQSLFHFSGVSFLKGLSFKRGNSDLSESTVELLGLIIRWVIVKNGVGTEDHSLDKGLEACV